ncbi:MAG: molybdate ABC transporter permease subunit [Candidatus Xenobia bacterium]
MNWEAVWLSVKLGLAVSGILLLLGAPLAAWFALSQWRARYLLEAVVALPLVLPPTVLGYYLLLAFSPHGILPGFAFTFHGLLLASVIYSLPFAVQPYAAGFAAVDRRYLQASWMLGESKLRTLWRVLLPLARPSLLAGTVLSFAHTVGEFGVVLMVGGDIPGVTRTLSIDIYDNVQALDFSAANHTALVLLLFSFGVLSVTYAANRRALSRWS